MSFRFLLSLLLLYIGAAGVRSDERHAMLCPPFNGRLSDLNLQQTPRRVLLVPLLSGEGNMRWSERPARILEAFYRNSFNAEVKQLRDVWSWTDYYWQVEQLIPQSASFDRVIFIGHGGFDGPILEDAVFLQNFQITGTKAKFIQFSESQPGLKSVLSISYDTQKNRIFSDYMASHLPELAAMSFPDNWHSLTELEKQLQPLDSACFQRRCSPEQLATKQGEQLEYQLHVCNLFCRESLFQLSISDEIFPERFFNFTNSLSSLVTADGLIFFGACNPGSTAPKEIVWRNEAEFLINSTLAGGPYRSYVHLISAATDRMIAGPIGTSSADDIVNKIIKFETNLPQHKLCIAYPSALK